VPAAGYLFVDDVEVVHMVAAICPIAALYQFPDGILGCIGGVLRGMGRQAYLMAFNLIGGPDCATVPNEPMTLSQWQRSQSLTI
jgi:Na+-driven multidrug efflux pump